MFILTRKTLFYGDNFLFRNKLVLLFSPSQTRIPPLAGKKKSCYKSRFLPNPLSILTLFNTRFAHVTGLELKCHAITIILKVPTYFLAVLFVFFSVNFYEGLFFKQHLSI